MCKILPVRLVSPFFFHCDDPFAVPVSHLLCSPLYAVEKFRKFATDRNVHITLVVHPRKEQEASNLSISSIYGSAKATQEADTVVIIQDTGTRKFLDVRKNRFNGDLGTSPLFFDRTSGRYQEEPMVNVKAPSKMPPLTNGKMTPRASSMSADTVIDRVRAYNVYTKTSG